MHWQPNRPSHWGTMLYHTIDAHIFSLTPARMTANALQQIFTHPWMPVSYTALGRSGAALCEMFDRFSKHHHKPSFGLNQTLIDGQSVAIQEEIVTELPFCKLLHFKRLKEGQGKNQRPDPKILVAAPMSGHFATLLRGTVEALLPDHDVYITDWVDAKMVPLAAGNFGFADYVDYIVHFLRHLGPNVHVMGVCQPSPPVIVAASMMAQDNDPCRPASMTLMGGPIDTRINPTEVNKLAQRENLSWFENKAVHVVPHYYPGGMRRVYPGFLQLGGFISMNPGRHLESHMDFFKHLVQGDGDSAQSHRAFYDEYLSVMDLNADFYIQTLDIVFQRHALPENDLTHHGVKVETKAIHDTALMTVEGKLDDISGVGQTKAAHDLCTNIPNTKRRHLEHPTVGHYGIFNGRKWRNEIYPQVRDFILSNDKE